jgi:hypothetical protein
LAMANSTRNDAGIDPPTQVSPEPSGSTRNVKKR